MEFMVAMKFAAVVAELGVEAIEAWQANTGKTHISVEDVNELAGLCKDPELYFTEVPPPPQHYPVQEGPK
jgi:hypothetical protein